MYPQIHKSLPEGRTVSYSWFEAMHSRMDIIICDRDEAEAGRLTSLLQQETHRLEFLMSRFLPGGALAELNKALVNRPVIIPNELMEILHACKEWHRKTKGLFDISIQSPFRGRSYLRELELNLYQTTARRNHPDLILDLGGYAKGYALDACSALLEKAGITDALLNFGNSSVKAMGNHPFGGGWLVGTENSREQYLLNNQCLTTSGNNSEQRVHIIRPGHEGAIQGRRFVSVVTDSAADGEALSTAYFAATPEEKAKLASLKECICVNEYH